MSEPGTIIACGILKNEIEMLARKNDWKTDLRFLDSSLHVDFDRLRRAVEGSLIKVNREPVLLVYGACHPLIRRFKGIEGAFWLQKQNCLEMLLGHDEFQARLAEGAFFLLEDWARRWDSVTGLAMGENRTMVREVFQSEHTHLCCIKTPCSGDFSALAEEIGRRIDLPVRWLDITLERFEEYLSTAFGTIDSSGSPS
jgi:Protein of unknown function (DUF1638)